MAERQWQKIVWGESHVGRFQDIHPVVASQGNHPTVHRHSLCTVIHCGINSTVSVSFPFRYIAVGVRV
jgi:hypothetical protein